MSRAFLSLEPIERDPDSVEFEQWLDKWSKPIGEKFKEKGFIPKNRQFRINPSDPNENYDYYSAFKAGVEPTLAEDGLYHWPSEFKTDTHRNRMVIEEGKVLDSKNGKFLGIDDPELIKWLEYQKKASPSDYDRVVNFLGGK